MADTKRVHLKQDVRDEDGRLYRAGRDREVPAALAERIAVPVKGAANTAVSAAETSTTPRASRAAASAPTRIENVEAPGTTSDAGDSAGTSSAGSTETSSGTGTPPKAATKRARKSAKGGK